MPGRKGIGVLLLLTVALVLAFSGCTNKRTCESVIKKLESAASYTCEAVMRTTNNKSTNTYKLRLYYQKPDKFRAETMAPQSLKGQAAIFNGSEAYIFHPVIGQYLKTENPASCIEHEAYFNIFFQYMAQNDKVRIHQVHESEKLFCVLETEYPPGNPYKCRQKLWLDLTEGVPSKLEIYDRENKVITQIIYENFKTNVKIDEGVFITEKRD